MIKLSEIKELDIKITWKMIFIGLCEKQISTKDVINYAVEQISNNEEKIEVLELAGESENDHEYILSLVRKLQEDSLNYDIEKRKIRIAIVKNTISKKNNNFIDGLLELTDLWCRLGYPDDSPHIIQGLDNFLSPTEYYTKENYDILYKKNYEWFVEELSFLQKQ